jgi:hypothetical protein
MPAHDEVDLWALEPLEVFATSIARWRLAPTSSAFYTNSAYVVAGYLLAKLRAQGRDPPDWNGCDGALRALVWEPLGMRSTGLFVSPEMMERRAHPYSPRQEGHSPQVSWRYRQATAWGAHTTAADLGRFLGACLGAGSFDGVTALDPEAVRAAAETPEGVTAPEGFSYGHGWWREVGAMTDILWHSGYGYWSHGLVYGERSDRRGVCLLTNSSGAAPRTLTADMRDLARIALRAMRGDQGVIGECRSSPPSPSFDPEGAYVDTSATPTFPPAVAYVRRTSSGLLLERPGRFALLQAVPDGPPGMYRFRERGMETTSTARFETGSQGTTLRLNQDPALVRRAVASPIPATDKWETVLGPFVGRWRATLTPHPTEASPLETSATYPPMPPRTLFLDVEIDSGSPRLTLSLFPGPLGAEPAPAARVVGDGTTLHLEVDRCGTDAPLWLDVRRSGPSIEGFLRQGIRVERLVNAKQENIPTPSLEALRGDWEGEVWELPREPNQAPRRTSLRLGIESASGGRLEWGNAPVVVGTVALDPLRRDHISFAVAGTAQPVATTFHGQIRGDRIHGVARGGSVGCATFEFRRLRALGAKER